MDALAPGPLLELWETGSRRHPIDRALLLFAVAAPGIPHERLADEPLGRRNAALMALRRARFGDHLDGWLDCPVCGERMEVGIGTDRLPPPPEGPGTIEVAGLRFRPPTSRDLAGLIDVGDPKETARRLLSACAESPQALPREPAALDRLLGEVDAVLEREDPWADLSLRVDCPACDATVEAELDIAAVLWEEVERLAQRLLDQVHLLAGAYGWRERDILAMSETRRAAYLARLQG